MALDEQRLKELVDEKLADKRADRAIRFLKRSWWRPLAIAGVSATLGAVMLVMNLKHPERGGILLYGGVIFVDIGYMCYWAYRQNCLSRAVVHKLEQIEAEIAKLSSDPGEQEVGPAATDGGAE